MRTLELPPVASYYILYVICYVTATPKVSGGVMRYVICYILYIRDSATQRKRHAARPRPRRWARLMSDGGVTVTGGCVYSI